MEAVAIVPDTSRVLVVEDEADVREVIIRQIEAKSTHQVTGAGTANEALELIRRNSHEVVLIDIRLPDMSGIDLLQKIKQTRPNTRSIMMTGWADIQDTIRALRCGAVDFFQKPLKIEDVLASVDRALELIKTGRPDRPVKPYLVDDLRTYRIPNDLSLVPYMTAELTRALEDEPGFTTDEVEGVRTSLHEMLLNAMEHGNLAITYSEKTELLQSIFGLRKEIEARATDPRYRDRRVTVFYQNSSSALTIRIADEGSGFDHTALPDPMEMGEIPHGRGILITRVFMDEVHYNAAGNEVTLIKFKRQSGNS